MILCQPRTGGDPLSLLHLIDAVSDDVEFLELIRGQSWIILGYLCREAFDLPRESI